MGWRDTIKKSDETAGDAGMANKPKSWRETIKTDGTPDAPVRIPDSAFAEAAQGGDELKSIGNFLSSIREGIPGSGIAKKLAAAGNAGLDQLRGSDKTFGEDYDKWRDSQKKEYADTVKENPKAARVGEMLGASIAPNAGILGNTLVAGADAATRADSADDATHNGLNAGGTALATQAVLSSLGGLGGMLRSLANRRAVKSLDPTLAQQELLNNKDAVQALGQELRDQGVVKFGRSVDEMAPKLSDLLQAKGKRIGEIRDAADAAGAQIDLARLAKKGDAKVAFSDATNEAAQQSADAYARNAANYAKVPKRSIQEAQEEIASLNQQIPFKKEFAERTPEQQAFSELRGDLVNQVDDQIRQNVPQQFAEHQDLKKQFGLFKDGESILDKSVARHARNADFGLRDLLVANALKGKDAGSMARTAAGALGTKLVRERGNSAIAATAGKMSEILSADPARLGKFAAPLAAAAKRGNAALMAAHIALMKDPEYAGLVGADGEGAK